MTQPIFSLIERHCEKLALATAATILVWMGWSYLLRGGATVSYDGRTLTIHEYADVVHSDALALDAAIEAAEPAPTRTAEVPQYHAQLAAQHAKGLWAANDAEAALPHTLVAATPMGTPIPSPLPDQRPVSVTAPLPPTAPQVTSGLATVLPTDSKADTEAATVSWACLRATLDVAQQEQAWEAAGYPAYACRVVLVDVAAQRQELRDGQPVSEWQDVPPATNADLETLSVRPVFDPQTGRLVNRDELDAAYAQLRATQADIAQPLMTQWDCVYSDAATETKPANEGEEAADASDKQIELVVYDLAAPPDRDYRYRLRVRCWNRFVGRPQSVHDAADARQFALASAWSKPSEPVRVAAPVRLFAYSPGLADGQANFEVWRWHRGAWVRKLFAASVGETIGESARVRIPASTPEGKPTRATVDLTTPYVLLGIQPDAETDTLVATLLNHDTGQTCQRRIPGDRDDPRRATMRLATAQKPLP